MKRLVGVLLLVSSSLVWAEEAALGEEVIAADQKNKVGYDIAFQTTSKDKAVCLDIQSCYQKCVKNHAPQDPKGGPDVPCSSVTYDLLKSCKQSCIEKATYVQQYPFKIGHNEAKSPNLQGYDGMCSTIENCMRFYHEKLRWPFQCAHIYCTHIDPEDTRPRKVNEEIPDTTNDLAFTDKSKAKDKLPDEFRQQASEF